MDKINKAPVLNSEPRYPSWPLIDQEMIEKVNHVLRSGKLNYWVGENCQKFEEEYAESSNCDYAIAVANGTLALELALYAVGIGPGDEVITTALSWISTSQTVSQTGARVVFVDIEEDYFTIDPARIEEKITSRTRAIIPVHLYGQAADMNSIMSIAKKHDLIVIEDCAQAHFAKYSDRTVGTFGIASTFSFFPGKNLGAYGDAGAIISRDEKFSTRARMFANHGSLVKHQHEIEGINSRLDGIQAAVLSVKLKRIHEWNNQRRKIGLIYSETNH